VVRYATMENSEVAVVKQRKIAISLAVIGALPAPFALQSYKMRYPELPWYKHYFTVAEIQQIKDNIARLCSKEELSSVCNDERQSLEKGSYYYSEPSVVLYLLLNAGVAVAAFGVIFGLTYLLPQ
jgi:hypothetical protein